MAASNHLLSIEKPRNASNLEKSRIRNPRDYAVDEIYFEQGISRSYSLLKPIEIFLQKHQCAVTGYPAKYVPELSTWR